VKEKGEGKGGGKKRKNKKNLHPLSLSFDEKKKKKHGKRQGGRASPYAASFSTAGLAGEKKKKEALKTRGKKKEKVARPGILVCDRQHKREGGGRKGKKKGGNPVSVPSF